MIRKHTLFGAAGAGALVLVGIVGPASATGEESADVTYTCPTTLGLTPAPVAHYVVNKPPAKMVAGQKVSLPTTGTITLDAVTTGALGTTFHWVTFDAKIVTPTTASTVGQNLRVPKTTVPTTPGDKAVGNLTGSTIIRPVKSGTYTLKLDNLGSPKGLPAGAVTLNGYDASNVLLQTAIFPDGGAFGQCTNVAAPVALKDSLAKPATVSVSKDTSKTTVKASYAKAKKTATGVAVVKGKNFGLAGTGSVKMTLKRGTAAVKTITVKLNSKGVAKGVFKSVTKKGKYKIVTVFTGSAGLKGSTGTSATFTV